MYACWVLWNAPGIPALGRVRQEDLDPASQVSLNYTVRPCPLETKVMSVQLSGKARAHMCKVLGLLPRTTRKQTHSWMCLYTTYLPT